MKQGLKLLKRVRKLDENFTRALEELACLQKALDGLSGTDYSLPRVQSSPCNQLEEIVIRKLKLEENVCDLVRQRAVINQILNKVEDERLSKLLYHRFIKGESWNKVAQAVGYQREHLIKEVYPRALESFEKALTSH